MNPPEASPAYLTRCIEALLDALCEAHALGRQGQINGQFVETLRFANDLLDIISDGARALASDPQTGDAMENVRDKVRKVSALFPSSHTVH
jgi:hypothetical protein